MGQRTSIQTRNFSVWEEVNSTCAGEKGMACQPHPAPLSSESRSRKSKAPPRRHTPATQVGLGRPVARDSKLGEGESCAEYHLWTPNLWLQGVATTPKETPRHSDGHIREIRGG